ncbi:MAG TPA: penicillin-binding protein 2 [Gemmatimonadota bacterium]|nr:penicillin-binding protein 2 [Gemmatimonadota bacterium]
MTPSIDRRALSPFDPPSRNRRARLARLTIIAGLVILIAGFFRLQVVQYAEHVAQATSNQVRSIPLAAPRGFMFDRDGDIIAENLPAYSVSLLPSSDRDLHRDMQRIRPILGLDDATVAELERQYALAPGQPILLNDDLDYRTLSLLEETRSEIPGLLLQPKPRRVYPHGRATAHLTGYVAQISEKELREREGKGYSAGDILGKTGIESMYEAELRGEKGAEYMEVDAVGRRIRPWPDQPFQSPQRGRDLHLTVDLDLQRRAAEIFPADRRGAVVALDPRNGDVLLLYSSPSYDPNVFSGQLSSDDWRRLINDPARPLLDRSIQARYAPGSVFKLATAAMAMTLGVVVPDDYEDVPCRGGYQFGSRWFGCHAVHGWATLQDAIITSCDTYFYQVGLKLGLEEITRFGRAWRFDEKTGIDLPNEVESMFPDSPEWYDEQYGKGQWGSGVVLNLAIGQGEIAMTPLKIAQFVAAIVNGGELLRPRLRQTDVPPQTQASLPLSRDQFQILRTSISGVVNDWRGTAFTRAHYTPLRYTIGGKSGTTEQNAGKPHGWFVAVGPMEDPQIVVAVVVEEGGSGSAQSPLAIDLIQTYLDGRNGIVPRESPPPPPIALSESTPSTD